MPRQTYSQAINAAIREEMRRDERVMVLGEDVKVGGALAVLRGLADEFGDERVRNVPVSEAGFVGAAIGLAAVGWRPVVDLMFAPFIWCAMDQVCNQAAKWHYMSGGQVSVPVVYRMAGGVLGSSAAAQHTASLYAQFMQVPGLVVAVPSDAYDAKGLLTTAIRDPNPVLFFELAKQIGARAEVPDGEHAIPFGSARVRREGEDVTVVAIGNMVAESLAAAAALEEDGISVEVVDPRTLVPLDVEAILTSVRKTGRLVVADEATPMASAAGEIVALVGERALAELDAPPRRVCAAHVPTPFNPALERLVLPDAQRIRTAVEHTMGVAA